VTIRRKREKKEKSENWIWKVIKKKKKKKKKAEDNREWESERWGHVSFFCGSLLIFWIFDSLIGNMIKKKLKIKTSMIYWYMMGKLIVYKKNKKNYLSLYFIILVLPLLRQIPGSATILEVYRTWITLTIFIALIAWFCHVTCTICYICITNANIFITEL
jgi:hypothetical protein